MPPPAARPLTEMDTYLAAASPLAQPILQEIRRVVQAAVPDAEETMGYKMPAFQRGRIFFYFAAFKQHVGVYPPLTSNARLQKALQPYTNAKGNLRFPLDQPMPYDLIARLAVALAAQYADGSANR